MRPVCSFCGRRDQASRSTADCGAAPRSALFRSGRPNVIGGSRLMLGDSGIFDRPAEQFVPYAGHISEDVVLLMDGSVLACIRLTGSPYQLEGPGTRNARAERVNTLLRNIADDNV